MTEAFTTTARLFIDNDIIWVKYAADAHIDADDIRNIYFIIRRWSAGRKLPLIVDIRDPYTITARARECAMRESEANLATALLTSNVLYKYLSDIYTKFYSSPVPLKVFLSEEKALEWIRSLQK
jgi:hypothetical protein